MKVSDIMSKDLAFCVSEDSIVDAAKLMLAHDCGSLPVCDSRERRHAVGVITDRDITIRGVASGRDPNSMHVSDVMSRPVAVIQVEALVEDAIKTLEENQIRRVPVVDHQGYVVGVVSQADIARTLQGTTTAELVQEVSKGFDPGHD